MLSYRLYGEKGQNMKVLVDYSFITGTQVYVEHLHKWKKATYDNYEVHIFARELPENADYILHGIDNKFHIERNEKFVEFKFDVMDRQTQKYTPAFYYLKTKFQNMDLTRGLNIQDALNEITGSFIDLNESFIYDESGVYNGSYWNGLDYKEAYKNFEKENESGNYSFYIKTCLGEIEIIRFNTKDEANSYYVKHNGIYTDEHGFTYRLQSKVRGR